MVPGPPASASSCGAESDDVLWARGVAGDEAAFSVLVRRHSAAILGHMRLLGATPEEARDLCQETWLRVFRERHRYAPGRFRSWVHTIARNLYLDGARRAAAGRRVLALLPAPDAVDPRPEIDRAHGRHWVLERAGSDLTPSERAVVEHRLRGLEHAETSAATGIPERAVRVHLCNALRKLRRRWCREIGRVPDEKGGT